MPIVRYSTKLAVSTTSKRPASGSGGVAHVNVFGGDSYGYYSPAFVYSNNLSRFDPFIAEAASHEAGQNLGLSHDGTSTDSYYSGHGSGDVSWGHSWAPATTTT